MRILVFEQWHGGHYFNYLECLVPRLAQIADEVIVAITETAYRSPLFADQLGPLETLVNVRFDASVSLPRPAPPIVHRLTLGSHLIEAIRRHEPDHVFLPSADEQSLPLPLMLWKLAGRRVPVEGVFHYKSFVANGTALERVMSAAERTLLKTGAFTRVHFVNFLQYEEASRRGLNVVRFARVAGDPVPQLPVGCRRAARDAIGIDGGGRLLAMIGALDRRKAVLPTVEAFRAAPLAPQDRLLLAGKLDPAYLAAIERDHHDLVRAGRLIILNRFLSTSELRLCFAAADVNCSVYNDFYGLSSLMLKSLAANVPVIVGRAGWASAIVKRFEVGHCVSPSDTQAYAELLPRALDQSATYTRTSAVDRLMRFHSVENFVEGLLENFLRHTGSAPAHSVLDWQWVMEGVDPERRRLR
ncbi:MAG: glycosyltransferase [Pseudomonadota bacterium]